MGSMGWNCGPLPRNDNCVCEYLPPKGRFSRVGFSDMEMSSTTDLMVQCPGTGRDAPSCAVHSPPQDGAVMKHECGVHQRQVY